MIDVQPECEMSYDNCEDNSQIQISSQSIDNKENFTLPENSEPSQPVHANSRDNAYYNNIYNPQIVYNKKLPTKPPKQNNKKSRKNKLSKNNINVSNRSTSAKWRKVDPYIQNMPDGGLKMQRAITKKLSGHDNTSGYVLPPINSKSSTVDSAHKQSHKVYDTLTKSEVKKASSHNEPQKQVNKQIEIDYEKKNLERLQMMQARKAQELALMEEQRQKAQEERERLRQIVFKRAEEHRKIREQREAEDRERRELEEKLNQEKPKKKKAKGPPSFLNRQDNNLNTSNENTHEIEDETQAIENDETK